jgi:hypothetical protein
MQDKIKIANKSFGNVVRFKYLGKTVTNKRHIHEKNYEQITFEACLLPFISESFVFPSLLQNRED